MKIVLIADDNLASRELLRAALEPRGLHVIEAADGQEALSKIQTESPHLVLLDLQMPLLDGFAVLEAARELEPPRTTRFIALTAFAMESDRNRVVEAGFDGYVSKPISISEVREQVEEILTDLDRATGA